jgi:hypothetical protein
MSLPFSGEMMLCVLCGRTERSDPAVNSQWRMVEMDGQARFYACPQHFPPDDGDAKAFEVAYLEFLTVAMLRRNRESAQ